MVGTTHLAEIISLFDKAEREIKQIERLNDELPMPSINELRYSGYHIARAWTAQQGDDATTMADELTKAKRHAERALYDAYEIGIQYHLGRIGGFKKDYKNFNVSSVLKDYADLRAQANQANKHIQEVAEHTVGQREQHYQACAEHYARVAQIADRLDEARDDINAAIRADVMVTRRWAIGIVLGIMSLIIAFMHR